MRILKPVYMVLFFYFSLSISQTLPAAGSWENLKSEADTIGKQEWRAMLHYLAELHEKSTHPPDPPFRYEWEEIGPGYIYGPAFGHWDIVHQSLDVLNSFPLHSFHQLLNDLSLQDSTGFIPGSIWMPGSKFAKDGKVFWSITDGHPPLWAYAANEYFKNTRDSSSLNIFFPVLVKQIDWFEKNRKAEPEGFYYNDIVNQNWESGVDHGIRYDVLPLQPSASIDATSHLFYLYKIAVQWGELLGKDIDAIKLRQKQLRDFIVDSLYDVTDNIFYDYWVIKNRDLRHDVFESMWPIVVGAATHSQANHFIDHRLLDSNYFFTKHPISTVGIRDKKFSIRMWRGAAWNSMTFWAAVGYLNYNRKDAARLILERALDVTAEQFQRTGTIWEFYHPLEGNQEEVARKPKKQPNMPCKDYLGHNPLFAMVRLCEMTNK